MNADTRHFAGLWAEILAAIYLLCKGYSLVEFRRRTPVGEIDILAIKNDTLIAVEVKSTSRRHPTLERIDYNKRQRVMRALDYLHAQKRYAHYQNMRCDAIALDNGRFRHIINAW